MAAPVAAGLAVGPFLPLLAMGGAAAWMVTRSGSRMREHTPSDDERRRKTQEKDLQHNGANASVWGGKHQKLFLMGSSMKEVIDFDNKNGGYNRDPNVDVLQEMFQQHVDVEDFDRADTFYSLTKGNGEIRMRRRAPIVATLTKELHHPDDPMRTTQFEAYRHMPNWANQAQIDAMKRQVNPATEPNMLLKRYWDAEDFSRAAGQSFRYEGN